MVCSQVFVANTNLGWSPILILVEPHNPTLSLYRTSALSLSWQFLCTPYQISTSPQLLRPWLPSGMRWFVHMQPRQPTAAASSSRNCSKRSAQRGPVAQAAAGAFPGLHNQRPPHPTSVKVYSTLGARRPTAGLLAPNSPNTHTSSSSSAAMMITAMTMICPQSYLALRMRTRPPPQPLLPPHTTRPHTGCPAQHPPKGYQPALKGLEPQSMPSKIKSALRSSGWTTLISRRSCSLPLRLPGRR
jgi:hypothetical protein